jgi:hypothetical protein
MTPVARPAATRGARAPDRDPVAPARPARGLARSRRSRTRDEATTTRRRRRPRSAEPSSAEAGPRPVARRPASTLLEEELAQGSATSTSTRSGAAGRLRELPKRILRQQTELSSGPPSRSSTSCCRCSTRSTLAHGPRTGAGDAQADQGARGRHLLLRDPRAEGLERIDADPGEPFDPTSTTRSPTSRRRLRRRTSRTARRARPGRRRGAAGRLPLEGAGAPTRDGRVRG